MYLSVLTNRHTYLMQLFKILLMAALYFISGKISFLIANENHIITIVIFAAEGFALAGVLLFGKSILPGIFLGQFLLALSGDIPPFPALGIAIVNTIEAFIAWKILLKYSFNTELQHPKDLIKLFFSITFILQPFSAFFGTLILYLSSIIEEKTYLDALFSWWFGNTLGQMLWTPMLLLLYTHYKKIHIPDFILLILFSILFSSLVFMVLPLSNLSIVILMTMPIAIYVVITRGLLYASVMIVILSMVSIYATYMHQGVFSSMSMLDNIINLNFYILSHILIVLGVGILYQETKKTKEKLAKVNRTLETEVAQQVEELNKQNLIMTQQARLASMGEMLGMIAHQWRQPLSSINSNIAVVQMITSEALPENTFLEKKLDNVTRQTQFMSDTIEDFSSFFHPNKESSIFDPCITLKRALRLLETDIRNILSHIDCPQNLFLQTYENEFLQVLLTIFHNAIENFNAKKIDAPILTIMLKEDEGHIILDIEDNGGGIQTDKIKSVFDPYFTTNHTGNNSGLGLYMAKLLIEESMNGTLNVQNKNKGASFRIILPKKERKI